MSDPFKKLEDIHTHINNVLTPGVEHYLTADELAATSVNIAAHFDSKLNAQQKRRTPGTLWASDIGKPCVRQLFYEFTEPQAKEELPVSAKIKFLYGNILEELVLTLLKSADYVVEDEQKRVWCKYSTWEVSGKMDCTVIDGGNRIVCDVKSASSYSYSDYVVNGLNDTNDKFGYRAQLSFYNWLYNGGDIPLSDTVGFLFIDKQLGHIKAVKTPAISGSDLGAMIGHKINTIDRALYVGKAPDRMQGHSVPDGKSGNEKLCTTCSYCPFKRKCFEGTGMRTFIYSDGPRFLTKVVKVPNVMEITD